MKKIVDFPGNLPSDEQAPFDPLEYGMNVKYSPEHVHASAELYDTLTTCVKNRIPDGLYNALADEMTEFRETLEKDAFLTGFEVATKFFTGEGLK